MRFVSLLVQSMLIAFALTWILDSQPTGFALGFWIWIATLNALMALLNIGRITKEQI